MAHSPIEWDIYDCELVAFAGDLPIVFERKRDEWGTTDPSDENALGKAVAALTEAERRAVDLVGSQLSALVDVALHTPS